MTRLPWIPTVLLTLVVAGGNLCGQDSETPSANFKMTYFDPTDRKPRTFRLGSGNGAEQVEVPSTYIAGPFEAPLRDGRWLDLFPPGVRDPALTVEVPEALRRHLLLVIVPKEAGYKALRVSLGEDSMKGSDRLFVNATAKPMTVRFGNAAPVAVSPGTSAVLKGPRGEQTEMRKVTIHWREEEDGPWQLILTETWACDPRFREFLFVYVSERTRRIAFHGLNDPVEEIPRE